MLTGLNFEIESWRGNDFFPIYGEDAGSRGIHLGPGPEGLLDEPIETIWNSTAYQIGATPGGYRVEKRDITLPIEIVSTETESWQRNDSLFRKAFRPDKDSRLWCRTDEWGSRWLDLRLNSEPVYTLDIDPFKRQYAHAEYPLTAGFPRWRSADVTAEWINTTDTTSGTWSSGSVTVTNPTDTEMWLVWVVQAYPGAVYELPDFSHGDDRYERADIDATRKIRLPALVAGEHLVVNTDDQQDQVVSNIDTQVYQRMAGVRFLYPVPPETKSLVLPVAVKNAPAGVGVQVRCPMNWSRPWGLDD